MSGHQNSSAESCELAERLKKRAQHHERDTYGGLGYFSDVDSKLMRDAADEIDRLQNHKRLQMEDIMTLGQEVGRLTTAAQPARETALEAAALDFIAKVDRGEARSTKSYAAFKAALASQPSPAATVETGVLGRENDAFHRALRKYPEAFEALHSFWNDAFAGQSHERSSAATVETGLRGALQEMLNQFGGRQKEDCDCEGCGIVRRAFVALKESAPGFSPSQDCCPERKPVSNAALPGADTRSSADRATAKTQEYVLRAMSKNYAPGGLIDHLDIEVFAKAADEIAALRHDIERHIQIATDLANEPQTLPVGPIELKPITMSDIRLMAGEGKLSPADVLNAVNAMLKMRMSSLLPRPQSPTGEA